MNIKRGVVLVAVSVTSLAVGIYSQTTPTTPPPAPKAVPPGGPQAIAPAIPVTVYSGENFGYRVTSSRGNKIEGYFVIKVNGNWIPLPVDQPSIKKLEFH